MINLTGYQIKETIFKNSNSTILRGIRNSDKCPVVVKLLNKEYPTEKEISAFIREYEIADKITGDGIIKVYALEKRNNSLAIVMEDIGGASVDQVLHLINLNLAEKLVLAIQMTCSLIQMHQQNIIHKDVNPTNFIWNRHTNQVKIIDFGISTELTREAAQCVNLNILEGTLDYISPEQTGRINRPIDYRTDLYSIGVTLYELVTGHLPFQGNDELDIVYGHIAKTPIPPLEINPEIPDALSDIILKLMSKTAEERYQSAPGLKKDLEYCLLRLESKKKIGRFIPGQNDIVDKFEIPHKLYGREREVEILIESFEKAAEGRSEFLLVGGYSGVGKTSLIYEIRRLITGKKGYFISGKFDPFERSIPFYGIKQAFQELIRQLLAESQPVLDNWKQRLMSAMGSNGQIMLDIIPELEQVIGPQPQVVELNPVETQNRFQMTCFEFINVFAGPEHPLVVFLDDLQWSDPSTLDLLKYVLLKGTLPHVLFIGAYRDNEVQAGHPLLQLLEELKNGQKGPHPPFRQIRIKPLKFSAINQMMADTFHSQPDENGPLAKLILHKTNGNPFFINNLLVSLYRRGVFKFNEETRKWGWNLSEIKDTEISDNVVDFLIQTLHSLPGDLFEILKTASCIGKDFNLRMLYLVLNEELKIPDALWTAMEMELIIPLDNNYRMLNNRRDEYIRTNMEVTFRFSHDRIRDAIYTLIPEDEKVFIHKKIGWAFLNRAEDSELKIFEITNHLNAGRIQITEKSERVALCNFNNEAGKKARSNSAYPIAAGYFSIGLSLLSDAEWLEYPDQLFEMSYDFAESLFLSGQIPAAVKECDHLLEIAVNDLDKAKVYELKSNIYLCIGGQSVNPVIDELKKGLQLFDIVLPDRMEEIERQVGEYTGRMMSYLAVNPIESLINLPKMHDQRRIAAMNLLYKAAETAIQTCPPLFMLIELIMLDMSISHGTSEISCKNFVDIGIIQGAILGNYDAGYQFGETAFKLIDKYNAESLKAPVCFVFAEYISHWRAHYSESLRFFDRAFTTGLATGDIVHACFTCSYKVLFSMYTGQNLDACLIETEKVRKFLTAAQAEFLELMVEMQQYFIKWLQTGDNHNEAILRQKVTDTQHLFALCFFGQLNTMTNYLIGDFEAAERADTFAEPYISAGSGHLYLADHTMFQALLLIRKWKAAEPRDQNKIMAAIGAKRSALQIWADNCPANFAHKYYLLSAEIAIIENEPLETINDLFMKSLNAIGPDDFSQHRALCNELQGQFWLSRGNETIAKAYLREAYYLYQQWGAHYKVALLEKQYPDYFMLNEETRRRTKGSHTTTNISIDMTSILKSTQAISSEIRIEKLLEILIRTMIENVGAQRGCLLLKNEADNELYIEAIQGADSDKIQILPSLPFTESTDLCPEIVQYVARAQESVVIHDACSDVNYHNNPYISKNRIKSVLCMPVIYQNRLKGVVYLENNLSDNVFTEERLEILKILSSQASISIENASLYENMEEKVKERTIQLNLANEKLKDLSFHDPLTNLHNRRYTFEYISDKTMKFFKNTTPSPNNGQIGVLPAKGNAIGVFLIDIDHFKDVNDTYGHLTGDNVLIAISKVLKEMIGADDFLVRWGGEEFLIILYNTKPAYLKRFSREVIATIKETPLEVSNKVTIYKTCSLGYVKMPLDIDNPELLTLEQMINLSDYALYCAKEKGRNCAAYFKLKKPVGTDEDFKKYLINLSRNSNVNHQYFKIEFVKP